MMARIVTQKPDPGNRVGLHYSPFQQPSPIRAPSIQLLARARSTQNRILEQPIREVGLSRLLYLLDLCEFPRLVEERLLWAVEAKDQEEVFASGCDPVVFKAGRCLRAKIEVCRPVAVELHLRLVEGRQTDPIVRRITWPGADEGFGIDVIDNFRPEHPGRHNGRDVSPVGRLSIE